MLARVDQRLSEPQLRLFELLLARRLAGEPMAYIRGDQEFFGRRFVVDPRVLIPRPETEHVVEAALELPLPPWPSILDIGTGSGCLGLTLAVELPAARVVATDISVAALAVAQQNVTRQELAGRVRLIAGDLASALDLRRFDLVVSNPPYIGLREAELLSPEIRDFEPETALFAGVDGTALVERLLGALSGLRSGAWLLVEIAAGHQELIQRLSEGSPFRCLEVRPDYSGQPRVALLQRR